VANVGVGEACDASDDDCEPPETHPRRAWRRGASGVQQSQQQIWRPQNSPDGDGDVVADIRWR